MDMTQYSDAERITNYRRASELAHAYQRRTEDDPMIADTSFEESVEDFLVYLHICR